ncbi:enoyl-CoA hydratase-related protein [Rhodovulum steppense]|uniref:enoyl-CoA hydratase-related protein n=1 Tax=Rhodovulum steppense TaxID=540251 RepID=UPI003C73EB23
MIQILFSIPDAGGTYWLPRQVGFSRAMGAALFAEPVPARQAADWGMIWEAVPEAGFEAHWRTRAAQLARGPTVAYAKLKAAIRASYANDLEAQLQGACGATRDFKEGVLAFLEKRPPRFEGR